MTSHRLPILIQEVMVLPGELGELHLSKPEDKALAHYSMEEELQIGLLCQIEDKVAIFGTLIKITGVQEITKDNGLVLKIVGCAGFKIKKLMQKSQSSDYSFGDVEILEYPPTKSDLKKLKTVYHKIALKEETKTPYLSFEVASLLKMDNGKKIVLLSIANEESRQKFVLNFIQENDALKI